MNLSRPPITRAQYVLVVLFGLAVFGLSYFDARLFILDHISDQSAQVSYYFAPQKPPCYVYLSVGRSGKEGNVAFAVDENRALSGDYSVYVRKPADLLPGGGTNFTVNALSAKGSIIAQYGFKDIPFVIAENFAEDGTISGEVIELPESYSDLFVPYNSAIAKLVVVLGKKSITLTSAALPSCYR